MKLKPLSTGMKILRIMLYAPVLWLSYHILLIAFTFIPRFYSRDHLFGIFFTCVLLAIFIVLLVVTTHVFRGKRLCYINDKANFYFFPDDYDFKDNELRESDRPR